MLIQMLQKKGCGIRLARSFPRLNNDYLHLWGHLRIGEHMLYPFLSFEKEAQIRVFGTLNGSLPSGVGIFLLYRKRMLLHSPSLRGWTHEVEVALWVGSEL